MTSSNSSHTVEPADTFELASRFGFAARGLVYTLIGVFAIYGGQAESSSGVLEFLRDQAFGRILVAVVGLGLLGYGAWRLIGAWYDLESKGDESGGIIKRLAHAGSGLAYIGLSVFAFCLAFGIQLGGGSGGGAERATDMALGIPAGRWLVMAAGLGFAIAGLVQMSKGLRDQHMENIVAQSAPTTVLKWMGRIGYVARGIVFVIVGWFIFQAGQAASPQATRTPGEALDTLVGWPALGLAVGFLVFGLFSLLLAYYRRINDHQVRERLNSLSA
ncbi:MAG: DUF1206 domain-containing protein [Hyphomicrobiales bacterium]|jgi:hypothetical protein